MRISISNIAWAREEDDAVAAVLARYGIDAIDVAPAKCFPEFPSVTDEEIQAVRQYWKAKGIAIVGMQALFYGTIGLNLFGTPETREAMREHLRRVCHIGAELGAGALTFGAPRNRDRTGLDERDAAAIASDFFRQIGSIASGFGVTICLEPNPAVYGCNFLVNTGETAAMVRQIGHPHVRLQLDSGAMTLNGELVAETVKEAADVIGHVHVSEPHLVTLGTGGTDHGAIAAALRHHRPEGIVTVEMLPPKEGPHVAAVERALAAATAAYVGRSVAR